MDAERVSSLEEVGVMAVKPVTICGSFGLGNCGDEAVALAISDLAEAIGEEIHIQILSRFHRPILHEVIGMGDEDKERREQIRGSHLLLVGGGAIEPHQEAVVNMCQRYFRDPYSKVADLFGSGVEAGRKYSFWNRWSLRRELKSFSHLYVRDVLSKEVLSRILPGREIEVIGDPVLAMKADGQIPIELQSIGQYVAVNLTPRWRNDPSWHEWITASLEQLGKEWNVPLVFFPMSVMEDSDIAEHQVVISHLRKGGIECISLEEAYAPRTIATILQKARLTIGMRLHAQVISYAQETPFIAIGYHPKVEGFVRTIGAEDFTIPERFPEMQSHSGYGFDFSKLSFEKNLLVKKANRAVEKFSFAQLAIHKRKLAEAFREVLYG